MTQPNASYILRYFPSIGLAESSRLLLTAAKVEWTEEHPEWPQAKPEQPHGRLPVLVEKSADGGADFVITESSNIERYLARVYGFLPADPKQAALQEQIRDLMSDVGAFIVGYIRSEDENSKSAFLERFEALFETLLAVQTQLVKDNGSTGRLFGDDLSYADIISYGFYKNLLIGMVHLDTNIPNLAKPKLTPEIIKLLSTVEDDPLVKKHILQSDSLAAAIST
ncbi:hypothetical protein IWW55_002322 [Coemansia sp. RSA 2706]|nr:hypothetical protein LPJ63_003963 [Coemansia sp. RSA 2711]KAJ2304670.1 hypothetical protein IWW55_002322 [Coemansia sp. RSA 2706]KAJ2314621.1 hypothetical protein IWW54_000816 [Coemansia sp. RSA 2705]KAJ2320094.1 hypothetical protein IWW52_001576 [Coemansia sp. RSA 2704]KAJ2326845.1 hypothetical protein IWW51_002065 [Coemansia sp. RSA 2702]KAJ2738214.1 hypothetical protein H4R23_001304 [Coemansia sp. Cherry 401B]